MSQLAIKVPATRGETLEIVGDKVGRFLVHEELTPRLTADDEFVDGFSVTLIENGCRFPWVFEKKSNATRFAVGVEKLMNWDGVACDLHTTVHLHPTVSWITGPSDDERKAVVSFASECGGIRT